MTCVPQASGEPQRSTHEVPEDEGFSLPELLVTMSLVVLITGAIYHLSGRSQAIFRAQPEVSDVQQRLRVASDAILKDLGMAGAGPYSGTLIGPLGAFIAPVIPRRMGLLSPDVASVALSDRISFISIGSTASQCVVRDQMAQPSSPITVEVRPGSPRADPLCGFDEDDDVLVMDESGAFDTFRITAVQGPAAIVEHGPPNQPLSKAYGPGAVIAEVSQHTYYLDPVANQLRHYDGYLSDLPVIDNVVGLTFEYFGDPTPPRSPLPLPGVANCVIDAAGNPSLPALGPADGPLVRLPLAQFQDGPMCGSSPSQFDADLYRVRTIRITIRVQVASAELRGVDTVRFARPGRSRGGEQWTPDYALSFDVTPRNLSLPR